MKSHKRWMQSTQGPLTPGSSESWNKKVRTEVRGKFFFRGDEKRYIRGVTYGPFGPPEKNDGYAPELVEQDFALMTQNSINAIRTYTLPPRWLLDAAFERGFHVLVGIPWEQHVAFLYDRNLRKKIERAVRDGVKKCAGHPAVLGYAIGNEIPSSIVRWHRAENIERFLKRLYFAAKEENPVGLFTYVNYPTTEYLQLPFLDFYCFNIFLEIQERLDAYLARLQNIAGDRPLMITEIGLDSWRNGKDVQARSLDWQIRTSFSAGAAGIFVFSWNDEWHRGGESITDWSFGLTDRQRHPKPALRSVSNAFGELPHCGKGKWPLVSVIVCTYNGCRTIGECLERLSKLQYSNFEVIIVNDGSNDATASIIAKHAERHTCRVIQTENRGLSSARNTGWQAARGEIVAYIDDDAYPDPHWLNYLALDLMRLGYAGVGGPNLAPAQDGLIAQSVAHAPGAPAHVLLSDRAAEHIPGCNMAIRKSALQAVNGFDEQFRVAADDVDLCWRLLQSGFSIGFSPAAVVWHHRRNTIGAYWKQQFGYGKAETLLERKWPNKYNSLGHVTWAGRIYGNGFAPGTGRRGNRIYQGKWGTAPYQSLYSSVNGTVSSMLLMPEWYLIIAAFTILSMQAFFWRPMLLAVPLWIAAILAPLIQALRKAFAAPFDSSSFVEHFRFRFIAALLHLIQPLARLMGKLSDGLTPWRRRGSSSFFFPVPRRLNLWSEQPQSTEHWLTLVERSLQEMGTAVLHGGNFDRWDLEVRGGILASARLLMGMEQHNAGRQLIRFRLWPNASYFLPPLLTLFGVLAVFAGSNGAWIPFTVLGLVTAGLAFQSIREMGTAMASAREAIRCLGGLTRVSLL